MEKKNKTLNYEDKALAFFTFLWGVIYIVIGSLQVLKGTGLLPYDLISTNLLPPEIADGLVLALVGAVYLYGTVEFSKSFSEGKAYAYVGIVLSLLFGALYLLTFVADIINAQVLEADGFEEWTPLAGIKPALYLGLISLAVYTGWENAFKLHD
ncbi:MAG: hypothetical protein QG610_770 [Euryarchaeota archaeon]|nr:hypothetical protein [Euryarchaeota archaeon]